MDWEIRGFMLRIGRMTDYATVLLCEMVRRQRRDANQPASAAELARVSHVPEPSVAKILKLLAQADILRSRRGKGGGYLLARPAEKISVGDVITAMEGPIALTSCVHDSPELCGARNICGISGHWNTVNRAVRAALDEVSVQDMAFAPPPFAATAYDTEQQTRRQG